MFKVPKSELKFEFVRSGGPGGQNVNKVATKVRLYWDFASSKALTIQDKIKIATKLSNRIVGSELVLESQKTRSQNQNKKDAVTKLEKLVAYNVKPAKGRVKTKPTKSAKESRLRAKRVRSKLKQHRRKPPLE